jgi:membrane associated rhomboid family serine protease
MADDPEDMMFLRSQLPIEGPTPVTWALFGLYVIAGVWQTFNGIAMLGATPSQVAHGHQLASLVTSMFAHAGLLQIFVNLMLLWGFSRAVESLMGTWRYILFFLACGVAGGLAQGLTDPAVTRPMANATAGVFGMMAAHIVLRPWASVRIPFRRQGADSTPYLDLPAWLFGAIAAAVVYFGSGWNDISWISTIGGGVAGALLTPLLCKPGTRLNVRLADDPEYFDEAGEGFRMGTLPSAALALSLVAVLGLWFVLVQP